MSRNHRAPPGRTPLPRAPRGAGRAQPDPRQARAEAEEGELNMMSPLYLIAYNAWTIEELAANIQAEEVAE